MADICRSIPGLGNVVDMICEELEQEALAMASPAAREPYRYREIPDVMHCHGNKLNMNFSIPPFLIPPFWFSQRYILVDLAQWRAGKPGGRAIASQLWRMANEVKGSVRDPRAFSKRYSDK